MALDASRSVGCFVWRAVGAGELETGQSKEKSMSQESTPWLLWPFVALWSLLTFILKLTGRVIAAVLALALMIIGLFLTLTLIAAPVGIPFFLFGLLLMVRSIF